MRDNYSVLFPYIFHFNRMHFSNNWFLAAKLFELFHKALQQITVVYQIKYIPDFTFKSHIMSRHNFLLL